MRRRPIGLLASAFAVALVGCSQGPEPVEVTMGAPDPTDVVAENPEPPVEPEPLPGNTEVAGEWSELEAVISSADDATTMTGIPEGFADYVATIAGSDDGYGCVSEITIDAVHPAGFVSGRNFAEGCGEFQVVWGDIGGTWGPVLEMQAELPCSEFENNAIPEGHPSLQCTDEAGALVSW